MKQALLVMDVQQGIVDQFGSPDDYLARLTTAVEAARAAGVPVLHVVIGFRAGHPEVSARNLSFSAAAETGRFATGDPGSAIHPAVSPVDGEVIVTKKRVSAFAGSDLDMVLRAGEIDTLVLTGIATRGVVLSTVRLAADLDYRLVVLSDGCLDSDDEVHRVLTEKVFPRQAEVITCADWAAWLQKV